MKTSSKTSAVLFIALATILTSPCLAESKKLKVADAKVIFCESVPAPSTGRVCDVATGTTSALAIKGNVLGIAQIFQGGEVLVDETGLIQYVGCSSDRPMELDALAQSATQIECAEGVISPGLINSHDHLTFDHHPPTPPLRQCVRPL